MINYHYGAFLGPVDQEVQPKLREWRNDPRIRRWCRQDTLIADVQQGVWFKKQSEDPTIQMFTVCNTSQPVGCCGLTSIDRSNQRAEFSLYIGPDYQGTGLGVAALKTLLTHGFRDLNLNVIWGECFEGNPANELFHRLGFKAEGSRREFYFKEGKFLDARLLSMTRKEYEDICSTW